MFHIMPFINSGELEFWDRRGQIRSIGTNLLRVKRSQGFHFISVDWKEGKNCCRPFVKFTPVIYTHMSIDPARSGLWIYKYGDMCLFAVSTHVRACVPHLSRRTYVSPSTRDFPCLPCRSTDLWPAQNQRVPVVLLIGRTCGQSRPVNI